MQDERTTCKFGCGNPITSDDIDEGCLECHYLIDNFEDEPDSTDLLSEAGLSVEDAVTEWQTTLAEDAGDGRET